MRGIGNHTPPARMQPEMPDNTSRYVDAQVKAYHWLLHSNGFNAAYAPYVLSGQPVHTEAAREIASWWQTSTGRGLEFLAFAGRGEITADLLAAIDHEAQQPEAVVFGSAVALNALRAYVVAASS